MKQCIMCNNSIPTRIYIDGKLRVLSKRKYCIECSPFGVHNTKKLDGTPRKDQRKHLCSECGEIDPSKFYGRKRTMCGHCHNVYTQKLYVNKKRKAVEYKGNECTLCGYNKFYGALEFHHIDPNDKDENFVNMRHWRWERMKIELDKCVLLCSNCHREVHGNMSELI